MTANCTPGQSLLSIVRMEPEKHAHTHTQFLFSEPSVPELHQVGLQFLKENVLGNAITQSRRAKNYYDKNSTRLPQKPANLACWPLKPHSKIVQFTDTKKQLKIFSIDM